jgi:ubiquinone/menaquinone biosynthesis C-methylase UbiE
MNIPPIFESERMPVLLGSPLKVASYAWRHWGAQWDTGEEYAKLVALSEEGYRREWDLTTAQGHRDIARAAELAGLGDANQRLNNAAAKIISLEADSRKSPLRILDVGAGSGSTTLAILEACRGLHQPFFALLDAAAHALNTARERLVERGFKEGADFAVYPTVDTNVEGLFEEGSFDVVVAVASIHHHADLLAPMHGLTHVLSPGGLFVVADWHNTLWEHPGSVLGLLTKLEWPGKLDDLRRFTALYPTAETRVPEQSSRMMRSANALIARFWEAYATSRTTTEPQFCILEGHRQPSKYLEVMESLGLQTAPAIIRGMSTNPDHLAPEGGLLAIAAGRKS